MGTSPAFNPIIEIESRSKKYALTTRLRMKNSKLIEVNR
jgi:hypothetical protein